MKSCSHLGRDVIISYERFQHQIGLSISCTKWAICLGCPTCILTAVARTTRREVVGQLCRISFTRGGFLGGTGIKMAGWVRSEQPTPPRIHRGGTPHLV